MRVKSIKIILESGPGSDWSVTTSSTRAQTEVLARQLMVATID